MAKRSSEARHSAVKALISGRAEPADLYVLLGTDSCLCGRMIGLICRQYLHPDDEEFNLDTIDCQSNPPAAAITNALSELPVMCDKRVLVLLNSHALSASAWVKVKTPMPAIGILTPLFKTTYSIPFPLLIDYSKNSVCSRKLRLKSPS